MLPLQGNAFLLFQQTEDSWQLCVKLVSFPTAFAHFMSLCHILVILAVHFISNVFIVSIFVMLICDQ